MKKYIILSSVFLLVFCLTDLTFACLKVGMPFGTPLDWIHNKLPRRPVTYDPSYKITPGGAETEPTSKPPQEPGEPRPGGEPAKEPSNSQPVTAADGATLALKRDPTKAAMRSYTIPFDPFSRDTAASADMPIHIPWVTTMESFNPTLDYGFRQLLIITFVRMMIYPESCPEGQTAQYLLEIGQPSLVGAEAALKATRLSGMDVNEPGIQGVIPDAAQRVARYLQREIGSAAEQPPPEAPKGKTHFETMVNRLIVEELGKEYYYSANVKFAYRLRQLGETISPAIIETAKNNSHSLIRHNATAFLGSFESPAAVATLREILKGNDAVARNRALSSLIQKGDREIVTFLIETLKSGGDEYFKTYVAYALGSLGDKRGVKPLLDYINVDPNNRDALWSAVPALGLLDDRSDEVKGTLKKIAEKKGSITKSMAWLALWALGEEETARKELKLKPADDPLKRLEYPVYYFALAVLGMQGKKNTPLLLEISKSKNYDLQLRLAAMQSATFETEHLGILKAIVSDDKIPCILRAYALYKLFELKDRDVHSSANLLLTQAVDNFGKVKEEQEGGGFEGVIALRILDRLNLNKELVLRNAIWQIVQQIKSKPPKKNKGKEGEEVMIVSTAPLLETAILELGKLKSREAGRILVDLLKQPDFPCRAEVALALGQTPAEKPTIELLIKTLSDENGWIRYCAYCSLVKLTNNPNPPGEAGNCEWVFDPAADRKPAVAEWEKWWKTNPMK